MNICEEPDFLRLLIFSNEIIDLLKIAISLVLIITGMITLLKAIMTDKIDLQKALASLKNKIIATCLVMLLPAIFHTVFFTENILTEHLENFSECRTNMNFNTIKRLESERKTRKLDVLKKFTRSPIETKSKDFIMGDGSIKKATHTGDLTLESYIAEWEGTTPDCDDDADSYKAISNGAITSVGLGITDGASGTASEIGYGDEFPLVAGECYPKYKMDAISATILESQADTVKSKCNDYGVNCDDGKVISITSLAYNAGPSKIDSVLDAYANEGDDGVISIYRKVISQVGDGIVLGLIRRRDDELELFFDGFTDNVEQYKSREIIYLKPELEQYNSTH